MEGWILDFPKYYTHTYVQIKYIPKAYATFTYVHVQISLNYIIYVPCADWFSGGNVLLLFKCGRASWKGVFDTAVGL